MDRIRTEQFLYTRPWGEALMRNLLDATAAMAPPS
jgi:hypothetical protein